MAIGKIMRRGIPVAILRWASGLRFPTLFLVTAILFGLNLVVPDIIPLADEILMGLVVLLLGSWRKKRLQN